jgi:hypothetical protein
VGGAVVAVEVFVVQIMEVVARSRILRPDIT